MKHAYSLPSIVTHNGSIKQFTHHFPVLREAHMFFSICFVCRYALAEPALQILLDQPDAFAMHTHLLSDFCAVHHLFGHEANLAVWRCLRTGPGTPRHGAEASVCRAAPVPGDREGNCLFCRHLLC